MPTGEQVGRLLGMDTMMTINETAKHYKVSVNTIRRRLESGLLTGNKISNKWFIHVASPNGASPNYPQQEPEPPTLAHTLQSRIDSMELELESRRNEINQLHQLLAAHSLNPGQHKSWWAFWR